MKKISVAVAGGSGYAGGELLRLLLFHPYIEVKQATSERFDGKFIHKAHPNLRKSTSLKFCTLDKLESCDVLFLCLPHGKSMHGLASFREKAEKIIDLSADFRLQSDDLYQQWYQQPHANSQYLQEFVYGIPELHREEMQKAAFVSSAGCNATATILALFPLFKKDLVDPEMSVVEVKVGSSEAGNTPGMASHHPERSGCVRSFKPAGHRHVAEIIQELSLHHPIRVHFSATSIDMVRGVLATCHVFLKKSLTEKDIWKLYRQVYSQEPFIRIVKERDGHYRYPEPKILSGTNFCDIGFEIDPHSNRLVVISAIDNLMKGAAGQAVQAFNIMHGFDESTGLAFPGLHPI